MAISWHFFPADRYIYSHSVLALLSRKMKEEGRRTIQPSIPLLYIFLKVSIFKNLLETFPHSQGISKMVILNKKNHFSLKPRVEAGRMPFLMSQERCYFSNGIHLILRRVRVISILTGLFFSGHCAKSLYTAIILLFIFPANWLSHSLESRKDDICPLSLKM